MSVANNVPDRFGAIIKELRKEKDMSQQELAQKINSHQPQIGHWENSADFCPRLDQINALAHGFDVHPVALFLKIYVEGFSEDYVIKAPIVEYQKHALELLNIISDAHHDRLHYTENREEKLAKLRNRLGLDRPTQK